MYVTGAIPIGVPGCPEFADWMASMHSVRIVEMHRPSSSVAVPVVVVVISPPPRFTSTRQPGVVPAPDVVHKVVG